MRAKGGVTWGGGTCSQHPTREPGAKQATGRVEHGEPGRRKGAEVIAHAPGPGVDPPGQSGCGLRCMGAWLARGTREGVPERSAVPRSGRRVGERASSTAGYHGGSSRSDDASERSS
eukprot:scaffold40965_cov45-Phaeocystis_antarctica.AAC.1